MGPAWIRKADRGRTPSVMGQHGKLVGSLQDVSHAQQRSVMLPLGDLGRASTATELASYFADSFGNATRIDYGTGHETTFVALLYCLVRP